MDAWKKYEVRWQFTNRLCGSTPLSVDMITPWLESRKPTNRPEGARSMKEITDEVVATIAPDIDDENLEKEERTTLGFQRADDVLVMRGGTIKAHIKDCARILSGFSERAQGERSFSVKVVNCVYPDEYWIPILKKDRPVKLSDGSFDKAVHIKTPQGPRNALKRIHYIERPAMVFHLNVLSVGTKEVISQDDLERIFDYGSVHGYAGERGDGEGRYKYEIKGIRSK